MDSAEGGVRKHMKLPVGASGGRPMMATVPARMRTAVARKVAGYGLPVAGVGGVSAWVTAAFAHHVSTVTLIASGAMVATTVVAHYAMKCFDSYSRPETIGARSTAETRKAREETRQALVRTAIEEQAKAPLCERMLARHDLVTLAESLDLTGQELHTFATLLLGDQPQLQPEPGLPSEGNGVKHPRPVCPQSRTGRTRHAPLAQPPTRI